MNTNIYTNIISLCAIRELSVAELERTAGIGNGVIAGWRERSGPTVATLKKVADALNVSMDFLLEDHSRR